MFWKFQICGVKGRNEAKLKASNSFFIFAFRLLFEEHVAKYVQVVEMSYLQVVTISWVSGGEGGGR